MPDETYLLDMLHASERARRFVASMSADDFAASELHQSAVVKQLEIVGEAASKISDAYQTAHPEIPWRPMIGMRHRLVHDYTRIDVPTVWETVQRDLDPLIAQLRPLSAGDPDPVGP
jgi:uncharacterized protein with HEPN domain